MASSPIESMVFSCFRKASHLALKKSSQALFVCIASSKALEFFLAIHKTPFVENPDLEQFWNGASSPINRSVPGMEVAMEGMPRYTAELK